MPKSKRSKLVSLTKTEKKGREEKELLVEQIQKCVDRYKYIWVFNIDNMRNYYLKEVRNDWNTSRFFFGKNKIMAKALGNTAEEEYKPNLSKLAERLVGNVGLLFTDASPKEIQEYFENFKKEDYARSGFVATEDFVVPAGPVTRGEDNLPFPSNMEPQLRKLGLPTALKKGVVTCLFDYTVCKKGDTLTPEQAQLLKHFFIQMSEFKVTLKCYYKDGAVNNV
ncbi:ribosomal protein L10-domain-containing protein [Neocallimastix lanati (nom. inval.)]|jgi:mRNA turnover protein 4|uniref:Ribosome assembly factor mrt4 n=1 Tax=Neocallimastix californiae TaxID=1754190 RepID=A0A1Y2ACD6_9FUNG|nr:ribosomal protein L10-domain-containing protein [Neocallimastix sp. JGI-2020a]ORY19940.1 hypothetical protein LY90DRAFT_464262 [Neocallimastix californiae]|eukprot:ORY19940.1 hypothetical protein LY90DRAFT_464262 [Neocallimastix californiae]